MPEAVIYLKFTNLQGDRSAVRQARDLCRDKATELGLPVRDSFLDLADHPSNTETFELALCALRAGDTLITQAIDRLPKGPIVFRAALQALADNDISLAFPGVGGLRSPTEFWYVPRQGDEISAPIPLALAAQEEMEPPVTTESEFRSDDGYAVAKSVRGRLFELEGNTYPHREWIKSAGGSYDKPTKAWTIPIPSSNAATAELLHQIVKRGLMWRPQT